jgi:hypothetical protein
MKMIATGDQSGQLTAVAIRANGRVVCRCACGGSITVSHGDFVSHRKKSCGCLRQRVRPGMRFGRLTTVSNAVRGRVLVECDCGNEKSVAVSNLHRTRSCGCLMGDQDKRVTSLRKFWAWNRHPQGPHYRYPILIPVWGNSFAAFSEAMHKLGWEPGRVIESTCPSGQIGPGLVRVV